MESSQNFTRRLERLKVAKGWTDEDLAEQVGISRRMLYLMRTGKKPISVKSEMKIEAIEKAAGINATRDINSDALINPVIDLTREIKPGSGLVRETSPAYGKQDDLEELTRRIEVVETEIGQIKKIIRRMQS